MLARHCRRQLGSRIRRALIAGVALLGYLAGSIGFPLPGAPAAVPAGREIPAHPSCCCSQTAGCNTHCCCHPEATRADTEIASQPEETNPAIVWVVAMSARTCRGLDSFWVNGNVPMPPPARVEWAYRWDYDRTLALSEPVLFTQQIPPPTPPPRS
jgi:hypothetical protein